MEPKLFEHNSLSTGRRTLQERQIKGILGLYTLLMFIELFTATAIIIKSF